MEWFFVAATWVDVMAISACVGTLISIGWVVPRQAPSRFDTALWAGLGSTVAMLTAASVLLLVSRTLELSGAPFAALSGYLPLVVSKSHYGLVWRYRMAAVGVLWLCWVVGWRARWRGTASAVAALALLVVIFSRSATGHAGDQGTFSLDVWIDCLHLLGSAVWVGSLFAMSVLVFPPLLDLAEQERMLAAKVFGRLSMVAGIAFAAIISTGLYNAWLGLGGAVVPWHSRYGRILMVKLALVAWMLALGSHNRYLKLPALRRWAGDGWQPHPLWSRLPGWHHLERLTVRPRVFAQSVHTVHLESLLGAIVLLAAAALHHGMPPADMRRMGMQTAPAPAAVMRAAAAPKTAPKRLPGTISPGKVV